ncbi:hypothetical protein [uncultured Methanosphaera sp.]|nr:hypothetical protein [uncultured Methanosphaera sp.]
MDVLLFFDKKKLYGDKAYCNGSEGEYYYNNSCHFPVDTVIIVVTADMNM